MIGGKPSMIGLGAYPVIGLAQAREMCLRNKQALTSGHDPRIKVPTLADAIESVISIQKESWADNGKSEMQWRNSLNDYVIPTLGAMPVNLIQANHCLSVLSRDWQEKHVTMARVKNRLSAVMQWCIAQGYRDTDPTASLSAVLPKVKREHKHHDSINHADLAGALTDIDKAGEYWSVPACIRFIALTAVRSGEARGARWDEMDWTDKVWTIPAGRMKGRKVFQVPLSAQAMALLEKAEAGGKGSDLVFPSVRGKVLEPGRLSRLCNPLGFTVHGLRSTFRDWCGETGQRRELAELSLAHTIGNQTEQAYFRTSLLEQRREMMQTWADYLSG